MNNALAAYLSKIGAPPSKPTPDSASSKKWFSTKVGVEALNSKGALLVTVIYEALEVLFVFAADREKKKIYATHE